MSGHGLLFRGIHYAVQGTALGVAAGLTATDAAAFEAPVPAILQTGSRQGVVAEREGIAAARLPLTGSAPDDAQRNITAARTGWFKDLPDEHLATFPNSDPDECIAMPGGSALEQGAAAVPFFARATAPLLDAPLPPASRAFAAPTRHRLAAPEGKPPLAFDTPRQAAVHALPSLPAHGSGAQETTWGSDVIPGAEITAPLLAKRDAVIAVTGRAAPAMPAVVPMAETGPHYAVPDLDVTPVRVRSSSWPFAPPYLPTSLPAAENGRDTKPAAAGGSADATDDASAGSGQAKEGDLLEPQPLPRGGLAVSGGYSSIEGPVVSVKLARTNIGAPGRDLTLSGRYSRVQALMELGASDTNFAGTGFAVAPTFFYSRSKAVGFDRDKNSDLFVQTSRGVNFYLGRPLKRGLRFAANYRFSDEDFTIRQKNALCDVSVHGSVFCDALGRSSSSVLSLALSLDRRDSAIDPKRGFQLRISQDIAGPGGTTRFVRYRAGGTFYKRLSGNMDFSFGVEGGYAKGYNGRDVPLFDRFYIGGNNMRGFDLRGLGPKIVPAGAAPGQATAIGGKAYYVGRVELSFRLTGDERRFGAIPSVFVDAGSVFGAKKSELAAGETLVGNSATPRVAVGIGMTFNVAPGKLRFSVARPVKRQQGDRSKVFSISFGTAF